MCVEENANMRRSCAAAVFFKTVFCDRRSHVSKNLKGAQDAETIDTQWRDKSEGQTRDPTRRIRYKSHRCHSFAHQHKPTRTTLQTRPAGALSVAFSKDSHSPRLDLTTYATLSTDGTIEPHSLCAPLKHAMMQDTIADRSSNTWVRQLVIRIRILHTDQRTAQAVQSLQA